MNASASGGGLSRGTDGLPLCPFRQLVLLKNGHQLGREHLKPDLDRGGGIPQGVDMLLGSQIVRTGQEGNQSQRFKNTPG